MYKSCVLTDSKDKIDYVLSTFKDLEWHLRARYNILGFDGMQWNVYALFSNSASLGGTEWKIVPRDTYDPKCYGDIVIQKLIDEEKLILIQDLTEEEYGIQLALGTIIIGPRKFCALPGTQKRIRAVMSRGTI